MSRFRALLIALGVFLLVFGYLIYTESRRHNAAVPLDARGNLILQK